MLPRHRKGDREWEEHTERSGKHQPLDIRQSSLSHRRRERAATPPEKRGSARLRRRRRGRSCCRTARGERGNQRSARGEGDSAQTMCTTPAGRKRRGGTTGEAARAHGTSARGSRPEEGVVACGREIRTSCARRVHQRRRRGRPSCASPASLFEHYH